MKTDPYTKSFLAVIALMLTVGALRPLLFPEVIAQAQAATSQKATPPVSRIVWEYKTVYRERDFKNDRKDHPEELGEADAWMTESEDGKSYVPIDIRVTLPQLGAQGWELVAVEARSDHAVANLQGRTATCAGNFCNDTAVLAGLAVNGATSSDFWIFKSPKQ
jgi:hypothetical protein